MGIPLPVPLGFWEGPLQHCGITVGFQDSCNWRNSWFYQFFPDKDPFLSHQTSWCHWEQFYLFCVQSLREGAGTARSWKEFLLPRCGEATELPWMSEVFRGQTCKLWFKMIIVQTKQALSSEGRQDSVQGTECACSQGSNSSVWVSDWFLIAINSALCGCVADSQGLCCV